MAAEQVDHHGQKQPALIGGDVRDVAELAEDWRLGGTLIDEIAEPGQRREAFNIMLSLPRGTDPLILQRAAREFAQAELADHKFVMVLHDHQANPHVHISVRAGSKHGKRLNPRKADLHRWRETFAEKLRGWGVDAEATRQASRGNARNYEPLWRVKAGQDGRLLKTTRARFKASPASIANRAEAVEAWGHIARALAASADPSDRGLAQAVARFVRQTPAVTSPNRENRARFVPMQGKPRGREYER